MKTLQDERFIEVDGRIFKLAAKRRLGAFLVDVAILFLVSLLCTIFITIYLKNIEEAIPYDRDAIRESNFGDAIGCGNFVESVYVWIGENVLDVDVAQRDEPYGYSRWMQFKIAILTNIPFILPFILPAWIFVLFSEWSLGKAWLSLHVLDLKEINARNVFWIIENERQRVGDKLPKKVIVEWDPDKPEPSIDTPEKIAMDELKARRSVAQQQLETAIAELTARRSVAQQQVETAIADERKFEVAYEDAIAEVEASNAAATLAVGDGREAAAREALEKRNEYQRIADRQKKRYEQQKEVVKHHTELLETLELQTAHIQRKLDIAVAEHTNVDAETHLSEFLKEIKAFEALKMRLFDVTHQENTDTASENSVEIAGKNFKLASRMTQLYMFFMDCMINIIGWVFLTFLIGFIFIFFIADFIALVLGGVFAFFFICGREPTRPMEIQVLAKDGEPYSGIDRLIRRFSGVLQPLDLLCLMGKKRQRLGDKIAGTVVVKHGPLHEQTEVETESPEKILSRAITEMKPHLLAAREKVDATFEVQKQLQATYELAVSKANQQEANTITALEVGREDTARKALEKRNAYRFLAGKYKTQSEEQQQIVKTLRDLLTHFEDKIMEAEGQRAVVAAEQRNVEIEARLRDLLQEIQPESEKVEKVEEVEQDAREAALLAKAMVELDVDYQDVKLAVEFSGYAEDASIEQELNELKQKIRK